MSDDSKPTDGKDAYIATLERHVTELRMENERLRKRCDELERLVGKHPVGVLAQTALDWALDKRKK